MREKTEAVKGGEGSIYTTDLCSTQQNLRMNECDWMTEGKDKKKFKCEMQNARRKKKELKLKLKYILDDDDDGGFV